MENKENLNKLFQESINTFLINEKENILADIAERNLCGRLAHYMEVLLVKYELSGYFSDTEYNRKQRGEVKTILDEELQVVKIQTDIIVHSRGNNIENDNLIAIEMKKSYQNQSEKDSDRKRLRALTKESYDNIWSNDGRTHPEHVCGYILGIYIEIDSDNKNCLLEYYNKGKKISFENLIF